MGSRVSSTRERDLRSKLGVSLHSVRSHHEGGYAFGEGAPHAWGWSWGVGAAGGTSTNPGPGHFTLFGARLDTGVRLGSIVACVALGWPRTAWGLISDADIAEYTIVSTGCRVEPCSTRTRYE